MEDEYMKRIRENFYRQVRNTNWGTEECVVSKPRGRKPKPMVRAEAKPRTPGEVQASLKQQSVKKQKYNWFD